MSKIYISYRRVDTRDTADRLYYSLAQVFGKDQIFLDIASITPSIDVPTFIQQQIDNADVMLVLIGDRWLEEIQRRSQDSDWVRLEIERGLQNPKIRVIPVLTDYARMPQIDELPESLRDLTRLNAATLRYAPDYQADVERLIQSINQILPTSTRPRRFLWLSVIGAIAIILSFLGLAAGFTFSAPISDRSLTSTSIVATNDQVLADLQQTATRLVLNATQQAPDPFLLTATRLVANATQTEDARQVSAQNFASSTPDGFQLTATQFVQEATQTRIALSTITQTQTVGVNATADPFSLTATRIVADATQTAAAQIEQTQTESARVTPTIDPFALTATRLVAAATQIQAVRTLTPVATTTPIPYPDTDDDGFDNLVDNCPNEFGFFNGCRDFDGDALLLGDVSDSSNSSAHSLPIQIRDVADNLEGIGHLTITYPNNVFYGDTFIVELSIAYDTLYMTPAPDPTEASIQADLASVAIVTIPTPSLANFVSQVNSLSIYDTMGVSLRCTSNSFTGCDEGLLEAQNKTMSRTETIWRWILNPVDDTGGIHDVMLQVWRQNDNQSNDILWEQTAQIDIQSVTVEASPSVLNRGVGLLAFLAVIMLLVVTGFQGFIFYDWRTQQRQRQLAQQEVSPILGKEIFISYRRLDQDIVRNINDKLRGKGAITFFDLSNIGVGEWEQYIFEAIDRCDLLIVFLSEQTITSEWVRKEIVHAKEQGKVITPITYNVELGEIELPDDVAFLKDYQGVNYYPDYLDGVVERVATMYQQYLERREQQNSDGNNDKLPKTTSDEE